MENDNNDRRPAGEGIELRSRLKLVAKRAMFTQFARYTHIELIRYARLLRSMLLKNFPYLPPQYRI